jgi:glycosyltransferase involved in cell wall biosynthesis
LHLGLDHYLFAPIARQRARALLRLPQDKIVVAMGAVNLKDARKCGAMFKAVHSSLAARDDVGLILFGHNSTGMAATKSFGLVHDERMMPFILSAADIFVSTSSEEAFGQILMEASACGLPVVVPNVGGVGDIVSHGETGLLADGLSADGLLAAVGTLIGDASKRIEFGGAGRARVENAFTLAHQANAWARYLTMH